MSEKKKSVPQYLKGEGFLSVHIGILKVACLGGSKCVICSSTVRMLILRIGSRQVDHTQLCDDGMQGPYWITGVRVSCKQLSLGVVRHWSCPWSRPSYVICWQLCWGALLARGRSDCLGLGHVRNKYVLRRHIRLCSSIFVSIQNLT